MKWLGFHLIALIVLLGISISDISAMSECIDKESELVKEKSGNGPDRFGSKIFLNYMV